MKRRLFIDTWGWLVLADRRDPAHKKVRHFYTTFSRRKGLCVTSDYVLDEVITLLFRRAPFLPAKLFTEAILAGVEAGSLDLQRVTADRFQRAWAFRIRYADKRLISFTDFTSLAIMTEVGITDVLTEDRHFELVGLGLRCVPWH